MTSRWYSPERGGSFTLLAQHLLFKQDSEVANTGFLTSQMWEGIPDLCPMVGQRLRKMWFRVRRISLVSPWTKAKLWTSQGNILRWNSRPLSIDSIRSQLRPQLKGHGRSFSVLFHGFTTGHITRACLAVGGSFKINLVSHAVRRRRAAHERRSPRFGSMISLESLTSRMGIMDPRCSDGLTWKKKPPEMFSHLQQRAEICQGTNSLWGGTSRTSL